MTTVQCPCVSMTDFSFRFDQQRCKTKKSDGVCAKHVSQLKEFKDLDTYYRELNACKSIDQKHTYNNKVFEDIKQGIMNNAKTVIADIEKAESERMERKRKAEEELDRKAAEEKSLYEELEKCDIVFTIGNVRWVQRIDGTYWIRFADSWIPETYFYENMRTEAQKKEQERKDREEAERRAETDRKVEEELERKRKERQELRERKEAERKRQEAVEAERKAFEELERKRQEDRRKTREEAEQKAAERKAREEELNKADIVLEFAGFKWVKRPLDNTMWVKRTMVDTPWEPESEKDKNLRKSHQKWQEKCKADTERKEKLLQEELERSEVLFTYQGIKWTKRRRDGTYWVKMTSRSEWIPEPDGFKNTRLEHEQQERTNQKGRKKNTQPKNTRVSPHQKACELLGITPETLKTIVFSELRTIYRKRSLMYHPDKPGGTEEAFKEYNSSYEYLCKYRGWDI